MKNFKLIAISLMLIATIGAISTKSALAHKKNAQKFFQVQGYFKNGGCYIGLLDLGRDCSIYGYGPICTVLSSYPAYDTEYACQNSLTDHYLRQPF